MFDDFKSINPYNKKEEYFHESTPANVLENRVKSAEKAHLEWKQKTYEERAVHFQNLRQMLLNLSEEYGKIVTQEMGKPLKASYSELEKCAWVCDFYAQNTGDFLNNEKTDFITLFYFF